jgi:hypothetical protein
MLLLVGYTEALSADIFEFDPQTGTATLAGHLPHPVADARYVRIGERLLAAGGESGIKIRAPYTLERTLR